MGDCEGAEGYIPGAVDGLGFPADQGAQAGTRPSAEPTAAPPAPWSAAPSRGRPPYNVRKQAADKIGGSSRQARRASTQAPVFSSRTRARRTRRGARPRRAVSALVESRRLRTARKCGITQGTQAMRAKTSRRWARMVGLRRTNRAWTGLPIGGAEVDWSDRGERVSASGRPPGMIRGYRGCGMATPSPTAVEPAASRARKSSSKNRPIEVPGQTEPLDDLAKDLALVLSVSQGGP